MIARLVAVEREDQGPEPAFLEAERIAEALLFAAAEPLEEKQIAEHMPAGVSTPDVLASLQAHYATRGVNLIRFASKWTFRTATDLSWLLSRQAEDKKKLSKPALETLAIIAYHQPVTRAEIEDIRGVAISKGTLDLLLETGWVRLRGRRRAPGRPTTYGTTEAFLLQFGLEQISDLPGLEELRGAGLFDGRLPPGFGVPMPKDDPALTDDEDPLDDEPSQPMFAELDAEGFAANAAALAVDQQQDTESSQSLDADEIDDDLVERESDGVDGEGLRGEEALDADDAADEVDEVDEE